MKKLFSTVICAVFLIASVSTAIPMKVSAEETNEQSLSATLDTSTSAQDETVYTYTDEVGKTKYEYVILDDGTLKITKATTSAYDIVIPQTIDGRQITVIGESAFEGNVRFTIIINGETTSTLHSVTIPEGVKVIEAQAFYELMLTEVYLSDTVEIIGDRAFYGMNDLEKIRLSNTLKTIDIHAFDGCESLTTIEIPDSVTEIKFKAFANCENLTTLKIGSGLTNIGETITYFCTNLQSIKVSPENETFYSNDGVLYSKDRTKLIIYPAGKEGDFRMPNTVKTVGASAFSKSKVTGVTFSSRLEEIQENAFNGCTQLVGRVDLPDSLKMIGEYPFFNCSGITELYFGANTNVENYTAYVNMVSLQNIFVSEENQNFTSIDGVLFSKDKTTLITYPDGRIDDYTIPSGTTSLEEYSFEKTKVTSVAMPDSVTTIGTAAFYHSEIKMVSLSENLKKIPDECFVGCENLKLENGLPESLKVIGVYAFLECDSIESVVIHENVESIGECAFGYCDSLKSVEIYSGKLKNIEEETFYICKNLTEVRLPLSLETIDETAFDECPNVTFECYKNSVAYEFAESHDIPYTLMTLQMQTGDINRDGRVTTADAYMILRTVAKLDTLDVYAEIAADTNGDGRITSVDAFDILRYSAGYRDGSNVNKAIEV